MVPVGYVQIDATRIDNACNAYFKLKDLNGYIFSVSTRGIGMPDAISEPMGCYCMGYYWNRGNEAGDATDRTNGRKIEFKATSNYDDDLSSFGPDTVFDDLIFLRYDMSEDKLYIYDLGINSEDLKELPVSKKQTVADQQRQGRRPRLSLIKTIIKPNHLEPVVVFDIRRVKIIEDNR